MTRMRGIDLDLPSKLAHQYPEVLRLIHRIRPPDRFQDRSVREHAIVVPRKQRQQVEFLRRQSNFLVGSNKATPVVIDCEPTATS